jgi:chorismate mutase-like protein
VQIDSLDQRLLSLLNERAHVAELVGEVKKREGTPFFRPDRVAQVIDKMQKTNGGPLKDLHVAAIWREIMSACLALESPQRVAVLGPEGTFCEQAAIEYFGGAADLIYCASFDEVFHATAAGSAQYGVVGVENSTEGVVTRSLDLFLHSPTHVVGEVSLLVRHHFCLPQTLAMPPVSGRDCTSLIVSVPNRPGAVHDLLVPLKANNVSMTRFESRPARTGQWEYYFYIDLDGHPSQPNVAAALAELRGLCAFYKVLGAYPVKP